MVLWIYTCNRGFQPKLMGEVVPTELSSGINWLKSRKRWEKHLGSWNQHVQRPSGQRKLPMKNPKYGLRGCNTEYKGSMGGNQAAVVRRYQMWRESFLFSGHFHHHQVLARASRVPTCRGEVRALESDLRSYTGRMWKSPCSPLAVVSWSRVLCPASPLHPCIQSKLSLPRALPSGPRRRLQVTKLEDLPSLTLSQWASWKCWSIPESPATFSLLYTMKHRLEPFELRLPWWEKTLGWYGLAGHSNPTFNSVTPHFQMSALKHRKCPWASDILSWEGFAHSFGNQGNFPLIFMASWNTTILYLKWPRPHYKMFVDYGKSTSLFLFPKMLKDKFFSPKFPASLFLKNVTEFICYNLHEKCKHIVNHGPWASCHHPPWSHSKKVEFLAGWECLGTFGTLPFAVCKQ